MRSSHHEATLYSCSKRGPIQLETQLNYIPCGTESYLSVSLLLAFDFQTKSLLLEFILLFQPFEQRVD